MTKLDNPPGGLEDIREHIIGLGEKSMRKSYYPELQKKLADLERFKALLDESSDAILLTDVPSGNVLYASKTACAQLGYAEEECCRLTLYNLASDHSADLDTIFTGKAASIFFEASLNKKSGEKVPYEMNLHRVVFKNRGYVIAIARDITERKRSENALRLQASLLDLSPDGILVRCFDGTILFWSKGAESLYGWTKEEAIGQKTNALLKTQFPLQIEDMNRKLTQTGRWSGELVHTTKDGRQVVVQSWWLVRKDAKGSESEILESNVDITERKKAEEELRDSEEKFKALAESSTAAIAVYQGEWLVSVNPAAERISGYTKEELLGMRLIDIFHPDFKELVQKRSLRRQRGDAEPSQYEAKILSKSGNLKWVLISVGTMIYKGKIAGVATLLDITERKRKDEELLEAKAKGELYLDLMGHDLTNMNQALMGYLELIDLSNTTGAIDKDLIDSSIDVINRSSRMIDDVKKLTLLRGEQIPLEKVDVCKIAVEVVRKYSNVPGRNVTINYASNGDCIILAGDMLKDVFDNLVDNAIRHSTGPVTIDLTIDRTFYRGQDYVRIAVSDTGPGIPDDLKKKLFTTEEDGKRSERRGFGLYLIKTLIDYYRGHVRVEDRIPGDYGKGARFIVLLPAIEK